MAAVPAMHARLGTHTVARSTPVATTLRSVRRRLSVAGSHAIATCESQPNSHSPFLQTASATSLCASYANRLATGLVACDSWRRLSSRHHHRQWLHAAKPSPTLSLRCAASDASADSRGQAEADGATAATAGKASFEGGARGRSSSSSSSTSSVSVVSSFVDYLNNSWTQFHATASARELLRAAGYEQLREADEWRLRPGGKYFFTRNLSSIVAFAVGEKVSPSSLPLRIVAAHTDSPCLKLKPVSAASKGGCLSLAVQTYGGGLWYTWFDRDLSVAGRVLVRGEDGRVVQRLAQIDRPILRIPTLAIHLDRNVNTEGFKPNAETHLVPILATQIKAQLHAKNGSAAAAAAAAAANGKPNGTASSSGNGNGNGSGNGSAEHHSLLLELLAEQLSCPPSAILDFELNVCDTQRSVAGAGGAGEFIFSGRLDNLACCYTALQALIDAEGLEEEQGVRVVALFDNEEVGSESASGASSPTMYHAIKRIVKQMARQGGGEAGAEGVEGAVERSLRRSFLVSADMAHALHPNYPEKHEERHQPRLGMGVVVKHNANQRYATNLVSSFLLKHLATKHGLPCQSFVVRNDMGCGSTIGPILASGLGIRTVDVGIPQLSMHSIREMCASDDIDTAYHLFKAFYSTAFAEVEDSVDLDE
ncbi:hypothetical protein CLOP_g11177 [Closterium sp. NIES-67]|nr:hypothetical protein CLOP_g11177 [Closterium sp. NIES-67]